MALKENYKDSVFIENKKYRMINNSDGSVSFVDITDYIEVGDDFGANDVNGITTKVNELDNKCKELEKLKKDIQLMENAFFPNILYTNENGTNNDFNLSDSVENYESLGWCYRDNDGRIYYSRTEHNYANSFRVSFIGMMSTDSAAYLKNMVRDVNGKTVCGGDCTEILMNTNEIKNTHPKNIYITKVLGFNKKEVGEVIESNS